MSKKIIAVAVCGALAFSGVAHAHANSVLPSPGITPDSPFFFLDRLGEFIQEFFTFNPEAKAKLQIKFAGERIAEIDALVEEKGPEVEAVDKAKTLLLGNIAHAAEILQKEKADGKDITQTAKEIDSEFDAQEQLLVQTFQDARRELKKDRLELKRSLAEQSGDAALVASLEQQINDLELQDSKLKDTKDEIKASLRAEKEKIEEELDDKDKKEDEQEKVEEDKREELEDMEIENEDENEAEVEKQEAPEAPEVEEVDEEGKAGGEDTKADTERKSDNEQGDAEGEASED